jgi:hypothetical protein
MVAVITYDDSPLEGTGFEPSVPRKALGVVLVLSRVRADFSVRGDQAEATWALLEPLVVSCGTDGSNPVSSSGESGANLTFGTNPIDGRRLVT